MTDQYDTKIITDLWKRRHELTPKEWQEAAPVLLGICVAFVSEKNKDADLFKEDKKDTRPLNERLHYTASTRCNCGYGMAYDPEGEFFTESGSPFVMRPDQWECAASLLYKAGLLSDEQIEHAKKFTHTLPISFSFGIKGESDTLTTREPEV